MLLALLALCAPAGDGPWVGFVSHYPMVRASDDAYGASGSTIALVRAPWALIQPSAEEWSPAILDEQLAWAAGQGVRLLYVLECGPAHAPNWLRAEVGAAGELLRDRAGATGDPSILSPTYARRMDDYVRRVTAEIETRDTQSVVYGYSNGCEWWYPSESTFGELERAGFEAAMRARYGGDAEARAAWGLAPEGRIERPPVAFEGVGSPSHLGELVEIERLMDSSWCTTEEAHPSVEAGAAYRFEADARLEGAHHGGAYLEIAWLRADDPRPVRLTQSVRFEDEAEGWTRIVAEGAAPEGCTRAWLLLKSSAEATVRFREPSFTRVGEATNLLGNAGLDPARGGWRFVPWAAGQPDALTSEWTDGSVAIAYAPRVVAPVSPLWVEDWFGYTSDSLAEFIGHIADLVRESAPGKPIVTYLTLSFGAPFNWDYDYAYNVDIRKVFTARHYEGLGMQLCSADGDPATVTAGVEMVRDLGDPWLIDLQDFTAGVAVGAEAMTNTTVEGIRSGARGVVYYCWSGTKSYDFLGAWPVGQLEAMVAESKAALAEAQSVTPQVCLLHPARLPIGGLGERDPGRFLLLYKAVKRLGLGVSIVTRTEDAPAGLPLLSVSDVPPGMVPHIRRSTEATETGNTPPVFKMPETDPHNAQLVAELAEALAARLGLEER